MFREKLPMQGNTRSIAAKDGRKRGKQGKEVPLLHFRGIFAAAKTPLCLSGATPLRPLERAASSRTSYPSPSRKRQGSSTPSLVLSPKSHGFSGSPVCAAARFCETLGSMAVTGGHAPVSFPHCAHPCPASCPHSACGAATRASHRGRCGIRHTLSFSPSAAWRIPPASL